ncbi:MAG: UvrB/UvrC motif-containing protein, partial [Burkholderiales bacterium]|nr:UvrB/UvrC motif-containing protein [Burkholderiales bacterium]
DMPEVSLVAILDADKEGFLRSEGSLIQTIGRAARNANGRAILYADRMTGSMQRAIAETDRRRARQLAHNAAHGITPRSIVKPVVDVMEGARVRMERALPTGRRGAAPVEGAVSYKSLADIRRGIRQLEVRMYAHARNLEFEQAAVLRDRIDALRVLELELAEAPAADEAAAG